MTNSIWVKMHGGATHFPIALLMVSALFDLASWVIPAKPGTTRASDLRAAAFYTLVLGALSSVAAVFSGLVLSRGEIWGRGNLARHHLFLWPAFGLLIGLAVWRVVVGNHASNFALKIYLVLALLAGGLMGAAGYWGGELLLNG